MTWIVQSTSTDEVASTHDRHYPAVCTTVYSEDTSSNLQYCRTIVVNDIMIV